MRGCTDGVSATAKLDLCHSCKHVHGVLHTVALTMNDASRRHVAARLDTARPSPAASGAARRPPLHLNPKRRAQCRPATLLHARTRTRRPPANATPRLPASDATSPAPAAHKLLLPVHTSTLLPGRPAAAAAGVLRAAAAHHQQRVSLLQWRAHAIGERVTSVRALAPKVQHDLDLQRRTTTSRAARDTRRRGEEAGGARAAPRAVPPANTHDICCCCCCHPCLLHSCAARQRLLPLRLLGSPSAAPPTAVPCVRAGAGAPPWASEGFG